MKVKLFAVCMIAVLPAFMSCSSDDEQKATSTPLKITAEIQGNSVTRDVINATTFDTGSQLGIYAYTEKDVPYMSNSLNMRALFGTAWTFPEGGMYLTSDQATIYGYYPYSSINSTEDVYLNISSNGVDGQTDYLYGKGLATVNVDNPEAHLTFEHALARLTLSILRDNSGSGKGYLSNVVLRNTSGNTIISSTGTMNVKTGIIKRNLSNSAYVNVTSHKYLNDTVSTVVDILMMPANVNDNALLVLTIDGCEYGVKLPTLSFMSGFQYKFPININIVNPEKKCFFRHHSPLFT
jgi:hypothetical protein